MNVKKIITTKQPEYLYRRLAREEKSYNYDLRPRGREGCLELPRVKGHIAQKSFIHRGAREYNQLPKEMRMLSLKPFKNQLKKWTKANVPIQ